MSILRFDNQNQILLPSSFQSHHCGHSQINPSLCRRHFLKIQAMIIPKPLPCVFSLKFLVNSLAVCLHYLSPRASRLFVCLFLTGCLLLWNPLPFYELQPRVISRISSTFLLTKISARMSHIINWYQLQGRKLTWGRSCRSPEGFPFVTKALWKLGKNKWVPSLGRWSAKSSSPGG